MRASTVSVWFADASPALHSTVSDIQEIFVEQMNRGREVKRKEGREE